MGILKFLSTEDFNIQNNTLFLNIPKYALVLFWSNSCNFCTKAKNVMQQLNNQINGCNFALCNLDQNKDVIKMCVNSGIALDHVPFFVFFANKNPYMVYSGPIDNKTISSFILEVSSQFKNEYKEGSSNHSTEKTNLSSNEKNNDFCKIGDFECMKRSSRYEYCTLEEAYGTK